MKHKFLSVAALFLSGLLVGCVDGHRAEANAGSAQTKTFDHRGFTRIALNGSANMTIKVGSAESIKVKGSQSRIDALTSKVVDGELVFQEESSGIFGRHGDLNITVTVPNLEAIRLTGSGDVFVEGVKGDAFAASLTGSGNVEIKGEIKLATLSVTGSGDLAAKGLSAIQSTVSIVGSGDIATSATTSLTISINGSGDVTYFGDPKVTETVNGSGDVNKG